MAYEEKISDVTGAANHPDDRRVEAGNVLFPNDGLPSAEDLKYEVPSAEKVPDDFFSKKGPLFAACYWLNKFAQNFDGDAAKVPDQDLKDRILPFIDRMRRIGEEDAIILNARKWYREQAGK